MKHPDYPGVTSFADRHGTTRWRFRKTGLRAVIIPSEPHTAPFDDAYQAAIEGRAGRGGTKHNAAVIPMPGAIRPASLDAAWRGLQTTAKWKRLQLESQQLYSRYVEEFLNQPIPGCVGRAGSGPVADLRPRHIAAVLDAWSHTPHKARTLYVALQKLMKYAMLQEWIEYLPTFGLDKPETTTVGKQAWPPYICAQFERRWPIGTSARTAYELAKWLGIRRSDVIAVRWDHLVTRMDRGETVEGFKFLSYKGRNRPGAYAKFHLISPMLAEALAPLDRSTGTVLVRPNGQSYNLRTMTCVMRYWRTEAGIPTGYSFHGLRHAMGDMLAEAGATATESKDVLGHATLQDVNRYQKGRNQELTSTAGMNKVVRMVRGKA